MNLTLTLILSCCGLFAQSGPLTPAGDLQAALEKRLKVFRETEVKAEGGDLDALHKMGEYYFYGESPAAKDSVKAKAFWTRGASMGSANCASAMHDVMFSRGITDPKVVIERTKWYIIRTALRNPRWQNNEPSYPVRPSDVSESSFEAAKLQANTFLAEVKLQRRKAKPSTEKPPAVKQT
jgi:TPR repeat protein